MKNHATSLLLLFAALLSGVLGGGFSTFVVMNYYLSRLPESAQESPNAIVQETYSYTEAWETAAPAVVSIIALKDLSEYYNNNFSFFTPPAVDEEGLSQVSSGSGFIVDPKGLIVTNRHVVLDEEAEYVVVLEDGTELDAEVKARDTLNDIALVQIIEEDDRLGSLPSLSFADSDAIQIGDPVMAIGNALGEYAQTTTAGIVSARNRHIMAGGLPGNSAESLVGLLQTDAAINPGNSGGPLVNLMGEVIGMNTAIDNKAEGIGFAIPSKDIEQVLHSYEEFGRIVRPFLGVRFVLINQGTQERLKLDVDHGAYLIGDEEAGLSALVPDSPAEKAGLQEKDVILAVNGKDIDESFSLPNALAEYSVGETVTLSVWRAGETLELKLTLEERKVEE